MINTKLTLTLAVGTIANLPLEISKHYLGLKTPSNEVKDGTSKHFRMRKIVKDLLFLTKDKG